MPTDTPAPDPVPATLSPQEAREQLDAIGRERSALWMDRASVGGAARLERDLERAERSADLRRREAAVWRALNVGTARGLDDAALLLVYAAAVLAGQRDQDAADEDRSATALRTLIARRDAAPTMPAPIPHATS